MSNAKSFLDNAYDLGDGEKTREYYRQWANTYDREVTGNGYASPGRIAVVMAANVKDISDPILDLGCGTGLSGEALKEAGFGVIDGTDFSQEMLALAETKNIYRKLIHGDLVKPIPVGTGKYSNITAVGVFSPGHAPAELIRSVMSLLPANGCFGFTLNDHALEDESYEGVIQNLCNSSVVEIAAKEYGAHLPNIGLRATVYVLRKL